MTMMTFSSMKLKKSSSTIADDTDQRIAAYSSKDGRKMKLNHPNYLYRVLPDLQKEGRIKRSGKGYQAG